MNCGRTAARHGKMAIKRLALVVGQYDGLVPSLARLLKESGRTLIVWILAHSVNVVQREVPSQKGQWDKNANKDEAGTIIRLDSARPRPTR